ncbi:MAG: hypothetical protein WCC60_08615, partial [Ilumatobacteraceae bacterium]
MRWLLGGQVFDVSQGVFRAADIGIDGERISVVAPGAGAGRASDDQVIDASGLWLLPGLIDCHVHLTLASEVGDPSTSALRTDAAITLYAA